ncbi:amino acid ABC transporter permease [Pseudomonas sp. SDI]|uniref:ABC transporter permease n=1 Tax=Pseudomonas sp. SDI TaxID=2170734 RepID=UPI000DE602D2|nr:ABC transporter permease subunit [Pseudomonas sp. SDI]PWB35687.1 amino acid ABC transporter permease [Pseudomonas sp. SDI]
MNDFLHSIGLQALSLQGFGPLLAQGAWMTLKLALLSLLLSLALGLLGASAKLSPLRLLRVPATLYTTLIRSVPDLVLILLIFYTLQLWLNDLTERLGWGYVEIDPFTAGVMILGFIYGAYFTENFRGAILSVPVGQLEAATAYGLSRVQRFRLVLFPQLMRFALPGLGNNWLVLLKSTALVSIIGLADLVKAAQNAGKTTHNTLYFLILAGLVYLLITTLSNRLFKQLERRYNTGIKGLSS